MTSNNPRVRYVLDTDTASAQQRGQMTVLDRITLNGLDSIGTTAVTMYEQFRGRMAVVDRAREDRSLQQAERPLEESHAYFCDMFILPFDAAAAAIYRALIGQRIRIGTQDLRIASIVPANDLTLITSNRRDSARVPDLRFEDWTQP